MQDITLTVHPQGDGTLVRATMGGYLTEKDIPKLVAWGEEANRVIAATYARTKKPVQVAVDTTALEGYKDPSVLSVLTEILVKDAPFIRKTATFGGSFKIALAQDVLKAFANRDNIRNFQTEKEALEWLAG